MQLKKAIKTNKSGRRQSVALRKRKRKVTLIFASAAVTVVLYAGLGALLTLPELSITTVQVTGNQVLQSEVLQEYIKKNIQGTRLLLLPSSTIATYNESALVQSLLSAYPLIKSVVVKVQDMNTLSVKIVERETAALFCQEQECYTLDDDGLLFASIDTAAEHKGFIIYSGGLSGVPLRQVYIHGRFAALHTFALSLQQEGIAVKSIVISDKDTEARILSEEHPVIMFKIDDNLRRAQSYLITALESEEYKELPAQEYIDIRFGNRVYYK